MSETRFAKLLSSFEIGRVKVKNRIVHSPHAMLLAGDDGYVNDANKDFYDRLARGGLGMIITEAVPMDFPLSITGPGRFRINDDKFLPGLAELVQVIHKHNCPVFIQVHHAGPAHNPKNFGTQPVAASSLTRSELPIPVPAEPRELTISEIKDLVSKYALVAERARKANFDGVEVHAGHAYLLNSFLSRAWNKRKDDYGGELNNRARFLIEVIQAIKEQTGRDYPVGVRINGAEYGSKDGLTPEESQEVALIIQKAGANYVNVSAFGFGDYEGLVYPEQIFSPDIPKPFPKSLDKRHRGSGVLVPLAAGIKKVVSIPVIAVGRLDPILAEEVLRQGKADLVAFARRLIADPELPNKVASGRLDDITPCVACSRCSGSVPLGVTVRCTVNPEAGKERENAINPAGKQKRVMIVGGGPAGMEAARVAALRGHKVVLFEREHELGGAARLASFIKGLRGEDLFTLIRYLGIQLNKLGVEVNLGKEVDLALIEEIKPDVVILAQGGIPVTLGIPGSDRHDILGTQDLHRMLKTYLRYLNPAVLRWLTRLWMPIGKRVVIIGGGIQGCQLAEFLAKRGRKVTILENSDELGKEMVMEIKVRLFKWFAKNGVAMLNNVKYEEITKKGITIITKEGERQTIEADTILPALRLQPNTGTFKAWEGKVPEMYLIGDSFEPHLILEAIHDGARVGRLI